MANNMETVTTERTKVFVLDGITYVPHYSKPCYVGPGFTRSLVPITNEGRKDSGREISPMELMLKGATPVFDNLWTVEVKKGEVNKSFRHVDTKGKN